MKNWRPKINEKYWAVVISALEFEVGLFTNLENAYSRFDIKIGNCFRTKSEAQAKLKKIKEILKD